MIGAALLAAAVAFAAGAALAAVLLRGHVAAEREARETLARRALALGALGEAVIVVDPDGLIVDWTTAAERMYGHPAAEVIGRQAREVLDMRVPGTDVATLHEALRAGTARVEHGAVHRRRDGTDVEVAVVATAIRDAGRFDGVVLAVRDVTAQRQIERALQESEARLSLALASSDADVWDYDVRAQTFYLGHFWADRLGVAPVLRDDIRKVVLELAHPDDRASVAAQLERLFARADGRIELEHRILLRDGTTGWAQVRGRTTERDPAGRPLRFTGTVRDVTEAKTLRAGLERADRLASLGTLAAGIAHEVNNPVAYVAGNLGFVRDELERIASGAPPRVGAPELRQAVDEALAGAARVKEIVSALKQFATPGDRGPGPVDVRAELDAAIGMTRHEIAHRARLDVALPPALPPVVAGGTELGQVFVNLLVNAAHAIPEGRAGENVVQVSARADAGQVVVEVRDTGEGIPADVLPRIFDPFFSTKPVGAGTGLGLSICHGIVNAAGGTIQVESAPGQGSTFRVILPAAPGVAPVARPRAAPPADAPRRAQILVVDDEPLVGKALGRILGATHDVTVTTSPVDALARLQAGERFDLVLCDLMMPEMNGMELEARIAQAAPQMVGRLVFMTGGAFTPAARAFLEGGRPHLDKPIDAAALRELIAARVANARS